MHQHYSNGHKLPIHVITAHLHDPTCYELCTQTGVKKKKKKPDVYKQSKV